MRLDLLEGVLPTDALDFDSLHQRDEPIIVPLLRFVAVEVHDKKLADKSKLRFPAGTLLVKDTGLQGYEPASIATLQPKKEPKGRELRACEKAINQVISRARIVVEHAIAGVKHCRIVADTFRAGARVWWTRSARRLRLAQPA